jgi:hypothetical protein
MRRDRAVDAPRMLGARRELAIVALTIVAARADAETRALIAADSYMATADDVAIVDVAWSAHLEWRELSAESSDVSRDVVREVVVDWVQREPLLDGTPRRELHELAYVDRSLADIAITIGRFRVPGGFWLMTDGLSVARRWRRVQLAAYAGSRSFTNGRDDLLLTGNPKFLPLGGAAFETRGDDVQTRLAYTYTFDRITLPSADGTSTTSQVPEQFVDGDVVASLGKHVLLTGGANVGSRYLVANPTASDPRIANVWFGSQSLYGLVDGRAGEWRVSATVAALRTKLGPLSDDAARNLGDAMVLAAISGSFVEGTLRATWRRKPDSANASRAEADWRVDGRYRVRGFADGRQAHRVQLAAEWRRDDLDVQASAGVDVHRDGGAGDSGDDNGGAGYTDSRSLLYKASIGRKTPSSEVMLGGAAVSTLGDELSLTTREPSEQRAPYTLEARSYAFVRGFASWDGWFAGVDGEYDLSGDGKRVLVQIGYGR